MGLKNRGIVSAVLAALLVVAGAAARQKQEPEPAKIVRLKPAEFPQLPAAVREDLDRRGCLIPQTFAAKHPENVISGKFREGAAEDWAVLCSREGLSSVLVFWNGSAHMPDELAKSRDADSMQTYDRSGVLEYSRVIITASPSEIGKREGNKQLGPFDHDGIDDGFLAKGSVIHYFRQRQWERLEGAD